MEFGLHELHQTVHSNLSPGVSGVIVPVDNRAVLPRGLQNQIKHRLSSTGIDVVFPSPFCSLTERHDDNEYIREFAGHFGRPGVKVQDRLILLRDSPCGNARSLVGRLPDIDVAMEKGALLYQHSCMASVDVIHRSAHIMEGVIKKAHKEYTKCLSKELHERGEIK